MSCLSLLHHCLLEQILDHVDDGESLVRLCAVNKEFRNMCLPRVNNIQSYRKVCYVLYRFLTRHLPQKCRHIRIVIVPDTDIADNDYIVIQNIRNTKHVEIMYGAHQLKLLSTLKNIAEFESNYKSVILNVLEKGLQEIIIWVDGVSEYHKSITKLRSDLLSACSNQCPIYNFVL